MLKTTEIKSNPASSPSAKCSGEELILARLAKGPIDLYYGNRGWTPNALPKGAKRADFDSLVADGRATINSLAQLVLPK